MVDVHNDCYYYYIVPVEVVDHNHSAVAVVAAVGMDVNPQLLSN